MPPGADHAQKLQETFPMRQTPQGGFVILPPDQASPGQQGNDLSPVTHQSSPRRFPGKQQRQGAGGPLPPHQQHAPPPNSLPPYRGTPPRRGLPFAPHSPQRQSPSYRGRNLQQPRHPQPGYGYYPNAPFQPYDAQHQLDAQSMGEEEGGASPLQLSMGMPYSHMQMGGGLVQMPYQQMGMMMGQQALGGAASNPLMNSNSPALSSMQLLQQQGGQQAGPGQAGAGAPPSRRDDIRKQMSASTHLCVAVTGRLFTLLTLSSCRCLSVFVRVQ